MLHHRVRSFRTVLIATAITSALAIPAGAATAAAASTPTRDKQTATTARTKGTSAKRPEARPSKRHPSKQHASKQARRSVTRHAERMPKRLPGKFRRIRKGVATADYRYDVGFSRKGNAGKALGTMEWTDKGSSNDGQLRDKGPGRSFVYFIGLKRSDGSAITLGKGTYWADEARVSTDWDTTEDLKRVNVTFCKYWDPDDMNNYTCTVRPYNFLK
jgi:hypothetical protein